jgi:PAS domain S-box-containing protein
VLRAELTAQDGTAWTLDDLVAFTGARALVALGPEGQVTLAERPGSSSALEPADLATDENVCGCQWSAVPPSWAGVGITRVGAVPLADGRATLAWAWDEAPDAAQVAWAEMVATWMNERRARRRVDAQLADLTARVDNAQQLANMGDYDWHIADDTNRWSDQLYRIYGHEPQSFNASYERFLSHIHPQDRERIQEIHRRAYETGEPYEMVERVVRPDGSLRYLSSNGQVVRDAQGNPVRMRGTCVDITDRVLAEQARERLAARFRSVVDASPDAILVLDEGGTIVQANRQAHELLGGDPVGTPVAAVSQGFGSPGHDVEAHTLDGRPLELDVTTAELDDEDGAELAAVYLRDASLRHADESRAAELREAQVRHRQSLEINDDVVQGLTATILAMQADALPLATSYLERTLKAARHLMNEWSDGPAGGGPVQPGSLVRTLASTLPASTATPASAPAPGPRVLIVDDSADVRMLVSAQVRARGCGTVVGEAADGTEAVHLAATLQPDLILLDLSMPYMDGLEALPHILDAVTGVKVIVMSGFGERGLAEQVLAAGAAAYLEKGLQMDVAAAIDGVFRAA